MTYVPLYILLYDIDISLREFYEPDRKDILEAGQDSIAPILLALTKPFIYYKHTKHTAFAVDYIFSHITAST